MDKKAASLLRIKRLEDQIAKKRADLIREKGRQSLKDKKLRAAKLFEVGKLAEIAGVLEADNGFLLGLLLSADISPQTERWKTLKAKGDAKLKELDALRKKNLKAKNN